MEAETAFLSQIAKVKRRVVFLVVHKILLYASLIFLCIGIILLIIPTIEITNYNSSRSWISVSISISLTVALFICFFTRKSFLNVLVEIDRRFELQDKLSTAYEYVRLNKRSEFKELLMKDAAESLQQLGSRNILPVRFSYAHAGFILLFLTNVALYWMFCPSAKFQAKRGGQEMLENTAKLIEKYTIRRIENKTDRIEGYRNFDADKLERLSKELKNKSKTDAQRYDALQNLLKEVQGEQKRLENELSTRLDAAGIKGLSTRKIPPLKNLSSAQLEKLSGLLNQTLNHQNTDSIDASIESLKELDSIEKLISRVIDDLENSKTDADESPTPTGNKTRAARFVNEPENAPGDKNQPRGKEQLLSGDQIKNDDAGQPGSEKRDGENDESLEEMAPQNGYSSAAGNAKSVEEYQSSYAIEKSQGTRLQDKMASARTKSYRIHIRALTDIGEARQKEEEIIRTYHKEIESLLQKEEIPLNYREYIKNYFISIGMNTEEITNEFN